MDLEQISHEKFIQKLVEGEVSIGSFIHMIDGYSWNFYVYKGDNKLAHLFRNNNIDYENFGILDRENELTVESVKNLELECLDLNRLRINPIQNIPNNYRKRKHAYERNDDASPTCSSYLKQDDASKSQGSQLTFYIYKKIHLFRKTSSGNNEKKNSSEIKQDLGVLLSNLQTANQLERTDAINFPIDFGMSHQGMLIDKNQMIIVHKTKSSNTNQKSTSLSSGSQNSIVRMDFLFETAEFTEFTKHNDVRTLREVEEILEDAKLTLGEEDYSLLFNNCQHYVSRLRHGTGFSFDVIQSFLKFILGAIAANFLLRLIKPNEKNDSVEKKGTKKRK